MGNALDAGAKKTPNSPITVTFAWHFEECRGIADANRPPRQRPFSAAVMVV
jgi:hypothetical protein